MPLWEGLPEPCRSTPFLYGLPQLQNQSAAPLPKLSFQGAWAEMKPGQGWSLRSC